MNIYSMLALSSGFVLLYLAHFVYTMDKKNSKNKLFTLFCIAHFIMAFTHFMYFQAESPGRALLWMRVGAGIVPISVAVTLHFVLRFTNNFKYVNNKLILFLIYFSNLMISVMMILIVRAKVAYWGYTTRLEPLILSIIVSLWMGGNGLFTTYLGFRAYLKERNPNLKKQLQLLTTGLTVNFVIGLITQGIFPVFNIQIPELTAICLSLIAAIIGYGIWKYELFKMDITTAADNILKTMSDSLILFNPKGGIVGVNNMLLNLLEYKESELINLNIKKIFKEKEFFDELIVKVEQKEVVSGIDLNSVTKSGREIPVMFSASAIRNKNKELAGIVGLAVDISERKETEVKLNQALESLKRSNEALEQFAYIASHDLQEPLRKISSFGQRLNEKYGEVLEGQGRDYLDRMMNAAVRMQALIEDLLVYSRVTTKTESYSPVDISKIVNDVLSDLEVPIEKTGAKVEVGPLPTITADPTQMRQLFQNLIGNALKFQKPMVTPVVKVYESEEAVKGFFSIVVEDNGIGIDSEYYGKIFGVFQRLHGREQYEGNGIGLAVCKKIVERHGGDIRVEGKVGEGTKFIVRMKKSSLFRYYQ